MSKSRVRLVARLAVLVVTASFPVAGGGCYERVVGARGLGSDRIETQEPYQQDTEFDRWFYGEEKKAR
ncbi:MAG: hypothetical protein AB7K52_13290 [Phycisphaerales bacterium]